MGNFVDSFPVVPVEPPEDDGLSEYERRFVEAYMGDAQCNGAEAVLMIGSSRNAHAAAVTAHRILKRPHVRAAMRARVDSCPLVPGRIKGLRLLGKIVLYDPDKATPKGKKKSKFAPTIREQMDAFMMLEKLRGDEHEEESEDDVKKTPFKALFDILNGTKTGDTR